MHRRRWLQIGVLAAAIAAFLPRRREAADVGFEICTPERGPDGTLAAAADLTLR